MDIIIRSKPWFAEVLKKQELQDITLRNLYQFYLCNDNILKILPIITSNSNISIRVLDWFVTNYSKKYNIIYNLKDLKRFMIQIQMVLMQQISIKYVIKNRIY